MVDIRKFWIEGVLVEKYPNFVQELGADLDGNGRIEANEVFGDLNHNRIVGDREDYQLYLERNRKSLSANVPFFKWGENLNVHNRIHQLFYLESDLAEPQAVQSAYHFIDQLVEKVQKLPPSESNRKNAMRPYAVMQNKMGVRFKNQDDDSFVENVNRRELDCDTSSFAEIAVGDELGWPLSLVLAPHHGFVRWEGDGERFNGDLGFVEPDDFYVEYFEIDPRAVSLGVYLKSLTEEELEGDFLGNRGLILFKKFHRYNEALATYDKSIELNPEDTATHNNRGVVLERVGRYAEALSAFDKAIELDPRNADAYAGRGLVLSELGRDTEALTAYNKSIELNPEDTAIHNNRGVILGRVGRYAEALSAFDKAIELNPENAEAHSNRSVVLALLSRYEEALQAYEKSVALNPTLASRLLELYLRFNAFPIQVSDMGF